MADKMQEHAQEGEEIMSLVSDISDSLDMANGFSDKDKRYAKRMLARRRIEMMKDEKELEKQLTGLDWAEEAPFQSQ